MDCSIKRSTTISHIKAEFIWAHVSNSARTRTFKSNSSECAVFDRYSEQLFTGSQSKVSKRGGCVIPSERQGTTHRPLVQSAAIRIATKTPLPHHIYRDKGSNNASQCSCEYKHKSRNTYGQQVLNLQQVLSDQILSSLYDFIAEQLKGCVCLHRQTTHREAGPCLTLQQHSGHHSRRYGCNC